MPQYSHNGLHREQASGLEKFCFVRNQFAAHEYKVYKESPMKVLLVCLLLLAPAIASSDWSRYEARRDRAEARRDRAEALRETRRERQQVQRERRQAIAQATRDRIRDRAQQRRELRESRMEAQREARQLRQERRSYGRWF
jgi:uncharacterized protein HemX